MPSPCGIVTLTTDFGLSDAYVAQMHAAILRGCPTARVVDLSHGVPPGQLGTALFLTESAWPQFPAGCVHVVVVDPGVGSDRTLVAIESPAAWFVGPDTGVLSSAFADALRPTSMSRMALPAGWRAARIDETPAAGEAVSNTFHGRDIMAPVAASLACGAAVADLGPPQKDVVVSPALATKGPSGRILHVDRFGNAVTSFRVADAGDPVRVSVTTGWRDEVVVPGVERSYLGSESETAIVVAGSHGYLEIAWPNGDAAERLGLRVGDPARLLPL